jgi:murein DD-endopeptidase MepM/ murein hydrolase activator NlpD
VADHAGPAAEPLTRRRARERTRSTTTRVAETPGAVSADAYAGDAHEDVVPSSEVVSTVEPAASAALSISAPAARAARGDMSAPASEPAALSAPTPVVECGPTAAQAQADVDAFEAAARLFSFTGETPVQAEPVADSEDEPETTPASAHKAGRRRPRRSIKRMAAASASVGAIVAVGLLTVGMTVPAEAVASPDSALAGASLRQQAGDVTAAHEDEIQAYVAPEDAAPAGTELDRSANYTTATLTEMAGTTGISNATSSYFTNNPACAVQWPFAVGVPITYGFGWRPGEFHTGADFTPGSGAHVQAIADGVVRVAQQGYQGYGVAVIIDHEIDGQHWASLYGHMQYGSLQVHAGEHVKVGQYIGRTGNTGFSFGAHTHVEIRQNGVTPIDPIPWLRSHNKC